MNICKPQNNTWSGSCWLCPTVSKPFGWKNSAFYGKAKA